jgi:hypothetical protein
MISARASTLNMAQRKEEDRDKWKIVAGIHRCMQLNGREDA